MSKGKSYRIFDEILLCQSNVETDQTQRWGASNATLANTQNPNNIFTCSVYCIQKFDIRVKV